MQKLLFAALLTCSIAACHHVKYDERQPPPGAPAATNEAPVATDAAVDAAPITNDGGSGATYFLAYDLQNHEFQVVVIVFQDAEGRSTREFRFAPNPEEGHEFIFQVSTAQRNPGEEPFHDTSLSELDAAGSFELSSNGRVGAAEMTTSKGFLQGASPEQLQAWLQQLFAILPGGEVGVGATWTVQVRHPSAPSEIVDVNWTLGSLSEEDAELHYETSPTSANGVAVPVLTGSRLISPVQPIGAGDVTSPDRRDPPDMRILWFSDEF